MKRAIVLMVCVGVVLGAVAIGYAQEPGAREFVEAYRDAYKELEKYDIQAAREFKEEIAHVMEKEDFRELRESVSAKEVFSDKTGAEKYEKLSERVNITEGHLEKKILPAAARVSAAEAHGPAVVETPKADPIPSGGVVSVDPVTPVGNQKGGAVLGGRK